MSSRMERYYKTNNRVKSRAIKNADLYKTIYDVGEYTNIEGIASIEKTNQIDLEQIRQLLKSVEPKENTQTRETPTYSKESAKKFTTSIIDNEEKSYDIRDVLNKAKTERGETNNDYRQLDNTQHNILKKIKIDEPIEEQELKELIHTITNTSMLNKMEDRELSLNLLSSLQSSEHTMANESKMIEENKNKYATSKCDTLIDEIDKSFFTSSMNFSEEDFEDLEDIKKNLKQNNILIKILTFILIAVVVSVILYIAYNFYQPN